MLSTIGPETGIVRESPLDCIGSHCVPNVCIAIAPVHILAIFTTTTQKAPLKTFVHKTEP
jgi:hypothetical protein